MELLDYPVSLKEALNAVIPPSDPKALIDAEREALALDASWKDGPSPAMPHNPNGVQMAWWR